MLLLLKCNQLDSVVCGTLSEMTKWWIQAEKRFYIRTTVVIFKNIFLTAMKEKKQNMYEKTLNICTDHLPY